MSLLLRTATLDDADAIAALPCELGYPFEERNRGTTLICVDPKG